jgi:hypothetical protein
MSAYILAELYQLLLYFKSSYYLEIYILFQDFDYYINYKIFKPVFIYNLRFGSKKNNRASEN